MPPSQTPPSVDPTSYSYNTAIAAGAIPSDPQIAVSTTHVLVAAGSVLAFYDKTGNLIQSQTISNFFSTAPLPNDAKTDKINKYNDPRAIFDPWRKRFLVGVLGRDKSHNYDEKHRDFFFLAVSADENPTNGPWHLYSWDAVAHWGIKNDPVWQPGDAADYPSIGIDNSCLYQTNKVANVIPYPQNTYRYWHVVYRDAYALSIGSIGSGGQFYDLTYPDGNVTGLIQPVIHHTPSTRAYFVSTYDNNKIAIWGLSNPLQPGQIMMVASVTLPDTTFIAPGNAPQQTSSAKIRMDNLGNNVLKAIYRDNKLYLVFNDAKDWFKDNQPINSIRLLRLDVSGFPKIPTSHSSGFINRIFGGNNPIEDDRKTRMYYGWPALEVNKKGDMAIVYARTGPTIYPEMRYSAYYASESDIRPSRLVREGQSNYYLNPDSLGRQRWGDTAGASVDPSDDTIIWIAHQFASLQMDDGNNNYRIWVSKVFS